MGVRKITVSLSPELVASLGREARSSGESVSAWVADAVARKLRRKAARRALDAFEVEHGALTDLERKRAKKEWRA